MTDPIRRTLLSASLLGGMALAGCGPAILRKRNPLGGRQHGFRPGEIWLDTNGKPIQAHAGALIGVGDTFYWYGENKEFTNGKDGIESWGIRFYASKDLYNWDDLGPLIPPDTVNPDSPLNPKVFPERPHILHNEKTGKYVCWIKIRGRGPQDRTVLVADRITGPYTMVQSGIRPAGMAAGDFDLVVDPDTGNAYMYFDHDHKEVVCVQLTDDYCGVTDRYATHLRMSGPAAPEGIACFRKGDKLYLTNSGTTGYFPNPSQVSVADDYNGPFQILGDLHPGDRSRTSYNSQISFIFKHPRKRNLYIALADRWLPNLGGPDFESGKTSENVRSAIAKATARPRQALTDEERKVLPLAAALTGVNTSISRYVWLPVTFRNGQPVIEWHDQWTVEAFD